MTVVKSDIKVRMYYIKRDEKVKELIITAIEKDGSRNLVLIKGSIDMKNWVDYGTGFNK